jgi:monofunctional biosynthetic peptidoglycan transglycosylase
MRTFFSRQALPGGKTKPSGWRLIKRRLILLVVLILALGVGLSAGLTALFRWVPPPASAIMLHRALSEGFHYEYQWTSLPEIAPSVALAVVAAEDQKFPHHHGFDFGAIGDAMNNNLKGGAKRGASTISQQVAKNLFLWEGRTWVRKGLEAWFTLLIETIWPKRRILEVYLNVAEMGDRVYGVQAASEHLFGIMPVDLSDKQAALLAAVLPNPRRFRVEAPSIYVRQRQHWILKQMRQLGGVSYLADIMR